MNRNLHFLVVVDKQINLKLCLHICDYVAFTWMMFEIVVNCQYSCTLVHAGRRLRHRSWIVVEWARLRHVQTLITVVSRVAEKAIPDLRFEQDGEGTSHTSRITNGCFSSLCRFPGVLGRLDQYVNLYIVPSVVHSGALKNRQSSKMTHKVEIFILPQKLSLILHRALFESLDVLNICYQLKYCLEILMFIWQ